MNKRQAPLDYANRLIFQYGCEFGVQWHFELVSSGFLFALAPKKKNYVFTCLIHNHLQI